MGLLLRFLLFAALVWLALRVLRQVLAPKAGGPPPAFEPTARCGRCGVHVPRATLTPSGLCSRCAAG